MPTFDNFYFISSTGVNRIRVKTCTPDGEVRGVVQIAHGIAEHADRYADFMNFLAENGFAVAADDHLGHGQSIEREEDKGFFAEKDGWWRVMDDLKTIHDTMKEKYPDVPYIFFGHSMGSFLARCYAIKWQDGIDGLILSGTGQQSAALVKAGRTMAEGEVKRHGARYKSDRLEKLMFGSYTRQIKPCRTPLDWLSRDPETVDRYMADPQCGGVPAAALVCDMLGGIAYMSRAENQKRMNKTLPVFFFSGDADPVGDYGKGVIRSYLGFLDAGMQDVTLKLYPGGRHEMLNEINRADVYRDILNWLNEHIK